MSHSQVLVRVVVAATVLSACSAGDDGALPAAAPATALVTRELGSAPSTASPTAIATAYLAVRHPAAELAVTHAGAELVRFEQRHAGLRVVGGGASVRIDPDGAVRWARDRTVDVTGVATAPAVSQARAIADAGAMIGVPGSQPAATELIVYAPPRQPPRLAWQIDFVTDGSGRAPRLVVAADDGALLDDHDTVLHDRRAWAFDKNPRLSTLAEVTLDHLPAGATTLADDSFDVRTCVDDPACTEFASCDGGSFWLNLCALTSLAIADGSGDFLAYTAPADWTIVDDAFAEVQLYHHLSRARAWFGGLGLTALEAPLKVVANYRDDAWLCAGPTADGPIGMYYNNAFYSPTGLLGHPAEPTLAFGNGNHVDFAWDGDVAVHELGHAVMDSVGALGRMVRDDHGVDLTPWAMHEGLADYFAIAFTGDPALAEWVGGVLNHFAPLRDLTVDRTCYALPANNPWPQGEPHEDGMIIAAALWDIRQGLAEADRPKLDLAMFRVISALDEFDTFATVADLVEAELTVELGPAAAAAAATVLGARGVSACNRVLPLVPPSWDVNGYGGTYYHYWVAPPAPADAAPTPLPIQFSFELTTNAPALTFAASTSCSDTTAYLKPGGTPIQWTWNGTTGTSDAVEAGTVTSRQGRTTYTFPGPFAPGSYHFQLANRTPDAMCELDPTLYGGGDDRLHGFAIGTEFPDDHSTEWPDGGCDLADPDHDADCYDGTCSEIAGDPDCPDGECAEGLEPWDPDCTLERGASGVAAGVTAIPYGVFAETEVCTGDDDDDDDDDDSGGCRAGGGANGGLLVIGLAWLVARRRRGRHAAASSTITGTSSPSR